MESREEFSFALQHHHDDHSTTTLNGCFVLFWFCLDLSLEMGRDDILLKQMLKVKILSRSQPVEDDFGHGMRRFLLRVSFINR